MKKLRPNGFATIEIILVIVVLIAIGGVGYYVWSTKSTPSKKTDTTKVSSKEVFADNGVSFTYPTGWNIGTESSNQITFTSPDFKEANNGTEAPKIESGKLIEVQLVANDIDKEGKVRHVTADNYAEAVFPDDKSFVENPKVTTINNYEVFQFNHGNEYVYTVFFLSETKRVQVKMWHANTSADAEQDPTYNQLLESFKLN